MKKNLISVVFLIVCFPVCLSQFGLGGLDVDSLLNPDTLRFVATQLAALLLDNKPLAKGLINTGLAAIPLFTGPPNLKPEIGSALIPWALEKLPKFLKDEKVKAFVANLKTEFNKVDVSHINQSDYNEIMNTVIGKASPSILLNALLSLGGAPELNPIVTKHLLPVISAKLPNLLNPLKKILHVFKEEVNRINVTDFNMTDNDVFVEELIQHFDILHFLQTVLTMNTASEFLPRNAMTQMLVACYHMVSAKQILSSITVQVFDAVGKPPQGIMKGNLHFIGQYDECLAVKGIINTDGKSNSTTESSSFGGRYCRATFNLPDSLMKSIVGDIIVSNFSVKMMKSFVEKKQDTHGVQPALTWGLCLPDSCSKNDVAGILHIGLLSIFDLTPDNVVCSHDFNFSEDIPAIITVSVILLIIFLVCLCTIIFICINRKQKYHSYGKKSNVTFLNNAYVNSLHDITKQNGGISKPSHLDDESTENNVDTKVPEHLVEANGHVQENDENYLDVFYEDKPGFAKQLVRAFSFHKNIAQIMSVDAPQDSIRCIYGVRFLSMVMIMLGNSYIYNVLTVSESPVSVRNYFLLINIDVTQLSGLERITPVYMMVMVIFSCLYHYIGNGPLWPEVIHVGDKCKTTWWHNLLYINNIVGVDGNDAYHQCMPWSWQLAVVMQFYLISPILVAFFVLSKKLGTVIVIFLMLAGIVSSGFKEHRYGGDLLSMSSDGGLYWNNVFIKPWCRVSSYCVGVLLGFALTQCEPKRKIKKKGRDKDTCQLCESFNVLKTFDFGLLYSDLTFQYSQEPRIQHTLSLIMKRKNHMTLIAAALGWVLALVVACTFIFITYTKNRDGGEPWTPIQQAVYESVGRPVWAACIAWVIFACYNGAGGCVNSFLSWPGFIPLSRLTYVVYLLHPVMMVLYVYSKRSLVYLSDFDMVYLLFGHIMINYLAAIPIAALFEYPFVNLERAVKRKL
ncbi:hypothetical protein KUTeg_011505 [Tegillarca granosa]|uniref:Nose resistant-to-fluoxetine protein N-terminal domain-containing protein n=1 Tax=Tegillarca granosa TaxID=220873 RepID=A0ABQ9F433_TEGGR|nr:hypothetical protein KUTeg_011505 [Tegillarca granosa]